MSAIIEMVCPPLLIAWSIALICWALAGFQMPIKYKAKKSPLSELVRICNQMDITEQLNTFNDAIIQYHAQIELAWLRITLAVSIFTNIAFLLWAATR